jgi:mannose-6-phosphate isomerase-like protein (cupin superfamily)
MQALLDTLKTLPAQKLAKSHIFEMLPSALSNVPFHYNTPVITRFFAEKFPLHMAVHQVSPIQEPPLEYTEAHLHEEHDEINIIISSEELVYKIQLETEEFTVTNNACIWIPAGMIHSANVLKGSGYFIAARL